MTDQLRPAKGIALAVILGLVLWAVVGFTIWSCVDAYGAERCHSVKACHAALRWQKHDRAKLRHHLAVRTNRDATYAVRLAAAAYGLPYLKLRCIAQRESGLGAQSYPESSSGASGLMQFLGSTWRHTPFSAAGFSVWDNIANALAAAQIIVHDGSARQWVTGRGCGL